MNICPDSRPGYILRQNFCPDIWPGCFKKNIKFVRISDLAPPQKKNELLATVNILIGILYLVVPNLRWLSYTCRFCHFWSRVQGLCELDFFFEYYDNKETLESYLIRPWHFAGLSIPKWGEQCRLLSRKIK